MPINLSEANAGIQIVPQPQSPDTVGKLSEFSSGAVSAGWLLADGSAVSRTTYSELFSAIGTTYGVGDGSTTFNLPNETSAYDITNMVVAVKAYSDVSGVAIGLSNATASGSITTDTLQADSVTSKDGTGAPSFPNGLTRTVEHIMTSYPSTLNFPSAISFSANFIPPTTVSSSDISYNSSTGVFTINTAGNYAISGTNVINRSGGSHVITRCRFSIGGTYNFQFYDSNEDGSDDKFLETCFLSFVLPFNASDTFCIEYVINLSVAGSIDIRSSPSSIAMHRIDA